MEGEKGREEGEWRVKGVLGVEVGREEMLEERAACVDVSREGGAELEWGRETLFVNASVVTRRYRAENAPWRVDLELPFVGGEGEE